MSLFEITILQNQVMIMEALAVLMAKDELKTAKLLHSMAKSTQEILGLHSPRSETAAGPYGPNTEWPPCPC